MQSSKIKAEISVLKEKQNAIILAHNYQLDEVQEIADYSGDSFGLSQQAASTSADVIVFCGVHFMAESAFILSPDKIILLPDLQSGCPLADTITTEALSAKKAEYPDAAVVSYVNSSAGVKALSDICCTSSNAVRVVNSLEANRVIFVPDRNLADYVARNTVKEIIPWEGCCPAHNNVTAWDLEQARALYPDGVIIVHPECQPEVVALADYVGSTSDILRHSRETAAKIIIIGTEMGTLYRLRIENPDKEFHLLSEKLICPSMKLITLEKIKEALLHLEPQVTVPAEIRVAAFNALNRMLQVS